ncbi:hypothetical protein EGT51_09960 [Levilactobacillus suantsaiihabitans]|uniref:Uncharacterized protein n=1 Tax=Levilactobacillus suantsaiihabitans TaxID=2487722 RepID=A0A4Z0J693_9LACO|nr:hypothetical protein EGT51_09960 [Levilactobacillus suantsaiihabitans]
MRAYLVVLPAMVCLVNLTCVSLPIVLLLAMALISPPATTVRAVATSTACLIPSFMMKFSPHSL